MVAAALPGGMGPSICQTSLAIQYHVNPALLFPLNRLLVDSGVLLLPEKCKDSLGW